jgi:hypothetical protein
MLTATGTFGPYDVMTLRDVVQHIADFSESEEIYVEPLSRLKPETPAIVTSRMIGPVEATQDLRFRFLSSVDDAREMIDTVKVRSEEDFQYLLERIEEWGA